MVIWLARIFEWMFFAGVVGCLLTIVLSWYSIFKDELKSN
jgi:hypothetical protein